ncbi:MAG: hypothetical protein CL843_06535 [Crocinitomicaceae bacterium]|nr:hypothetical protein [Crocinitomicaceae bacterium]|tara:strand:+ start:291 stop:914 length:624 start_codon:yes stop_codon:yes gene_type:complete
MSISKYRIEAFSDGVISIIITIMVLEIPLPETFELSDLLAFSSSLIIYLLSFLVVGAFWNQHHQALSYLEQVNHKIIVANIFFLFFLSLIPLFTKWVIQNQGSLIPVIGYDVVYLIVSFIYLLMFRLVVKFGDEERVKHLNDIFQSRKAFRPWKSLIILLLIVIMVVIGSIYLPNVANIILIGLPILSSIFNLFVSKQRKIAHKSIR